MGAPQKPVLILKARVFLREHMTISWQAKSLSRFAAALASVSPEPSVLNLDADSLTAHRESEHLKNIVYRIDDIIEASSTALGR